MSAQPDVILDASPSGVAAVILNRPDKHNAFNADVVAALDDAFETLRAADHVRVVLLRGRGRSFSAGADLEWMQAAAHYEPHENEQDALALARMLQKLHDLPQLTIAMVNGAAMGGGAGLVAACNMAIASTDAVFRFSEVRLGLTPGTISPFVIQALGARRARALFLTGESFNAHEAERFGLVHKVVADETAMDAEAERLATLIFATAPGAIAATKKLVDEVVDRPLDDELAHLTARRIAERRATDEAREGLSAFLEKRPPSWITTE